MGENEDLGTFIRELLLRYDRATEANRLRMERHFDQAAEERRRNYERLGEKSDEILAESRAGRQALLAILDRLDGKGGTAPA
jgi:hypothetical protein